jgi:hypothetical protein
MLALHSLITCCFSNNKNGVVVSVGGGCAFAGDKGLGARLDGSDVDSYTTDGVDSPKAIIY